MDDAETIYLNARDERAFSNGTDSELWMYAHCEQCAHDKAYRENESNEGCPILLTAMLGRTPREWLPGDPASPYFEDRYTCAFYRHEDEDDPDAEPEPLPDPPGMEALFPRELVEPGRVFIPLPEVGVRVGGAQ